MLRLLVAGSIILPVLVLVGGGVVAYQSTLARVKSELVGDVRVAQAQADLIFASDELVVARVKDILAGSDVAAILQQEQSLHRRIVQAIEQVPQVDVVLVTDGRGNVLVGSSAFPVDHSVNLSDRPYFQALRSGAEAYIGAVSNGRVNGQSYLVLAERRTDQAGGFDGIITVAVSPDYFQSFYDKLTNGNAALTAGLFREDGTALVRYPAAAPGGHAPPPQDLLLRAIASSPGGGLVFGRSGVDGRDRMMAYRKVEGFPAYVAEERPWTSVLGAWWRQMSIYLVFGVPATISLILLSLLALRRARREQVALARMRDADRQRETAEEALRQAQKMDAIGRLSGGIAHDFNNLLGIIIWNVEMLQRRLQPTDPRQARPLEMVMKAATRAATLTQRLLAFSRRQPLEPQPINPNKLVAGMSDLLHSTLGERIAVETVLAGGIWPVSADANQLESTILNLAVNARDAMPEGGKLTIESANAHLDENYVAKFGGEPAPGQYVMIAVSDTGLGMTKEVAAKAFEPFFTTKDVGQGTGLGLSQVYGFVKQSGGHVKIYSEPGEGTTVKLYLPRLMKEGAAELDGQVSTPAASPAARHETILVVEDDDDLRSSAVEALREFGYRLLEAPDGASALRLLESDANVDLLFTDVGLPGGLNGRQLADEARKRLPGIKVLFTTGYARNAIVHQGRLDPGVELIVKPFTYSNLSARIRRVLAESK